MCTFWEIALSIYIDVQFRTNGYIESPKKGNCCYISLHGVPLLNAMPNVLVMFSIFVLYSIVTFHMSSLTNISIKLEFQECIQHTLNTTCSTKFLGAVVVIVA